MPTEIRRVVDHGASGYEGGGMQGNGEEKHHTRPSSKESSRRKYAILVLCLPVLTGAYALMSSQGWCEEDDFVGSGLHFKESFAGDASSHSVLESGKSRKHSHAVQQQADGHKHKGKGKGKHGREGSGLDWTPPDVSTTVFESTSTGKGSSAAVGGTACGGEGYCGLHGKCLPSGQCACTVLYEGPRCEKARPFPHDMHPKTLKKKSLNFDGDMVLHQGRMKKRDKLKVFLPGKEKDADKGHRVLSSGDELKRLVQILPKNDTILNGEVYDKCAVVGSSGIVLSYEHGKEIDSHDFVMRFNSAPTKGFEKHVGSFTTHRITNTQNWAFRERDEENLMIHLRAKSAIVGLFYNYRSKSRRKKEWIPHLWAFDPDYVEFVAHSLTFMATSGLYGIMMAMQRCREVNIYGFHVSTKQGALYHYYDVCDVPANPSRDGDEFRFVKALANSGFIHFGEDCVLECHETQEVCDACKREKGFKQAEMASTKHCDPKRVSEGHNIVPWASRRARARFKRKHSNDKLHNG
ncbi:EGF-like domain-containing protein [Chloropicon primus]|uniref:beta-galactoside alpha-(2,6)-sialyltransferase n=2 Tax=Chloropicon primus TaxID=1764295 RepID=A0A5B8MNQ3_9CHLO|nr:hypothetical protein A3770_07p46370 [Chloropicon primus]UPR01337.1 EGF-like domain-containing protein [Chloropicon primus]|eukprot:QDZ22119.1 hypothetical protein A3770_07p46370 [Chloropicon primus]